MQRFRVLLSVALLCVAVPVLAADPVGTWKWSIERNGQTFETTLKIKKEGDKLTGTISGRNNTETPLEDVKCEADKLSFTVTREFNGNKFVMKYSGDVTDDTIKGKIEFERNGETREREWEAKRSSE